MADVTETGTENVSSVVVEGATPENSTVNPPAETHSDTGQTDGFDFGEFATAPDVEVPDTPVDFSRDTPTPEAAPTTEPAATTVKEEAPKPADQQSPQTTVQQTTPEQTQATQPEVGLPPAPAEPGETPEQQQEKYQEWYQSSIDQLKDFYKLPEDVAAKVNENPAEMMPTLMAATHMQAIIAGATIAANLIRTYVPQVQEQERQTKTLVDQFYSEHEQLKGQEALVDRLANAYIAANPKATRDDVKKNVATMAYMQLNIVPPALLAQMQKTQTQQVPAAVTPTSAQGGSAPRAQPKPGEQSIWSDLVNEDY